MMPVADDFKNWVWPADVRARFDAVGKPPQPKEPEPDKAKADAEQDEIDMHLMLGGY